MTDLTEAYEAAGEKARELMQVRRGETVIDAKDVFAVLDAGFQAVEQIIRAEYQIKFVVTPEQMNRIISEIEAEQRISDLDGYALARASIGRALTVVLGMAVEEA